MRRSSLGLISLASLACFALLAVTVQHGRTPLGIERPVLDWMAPDPHGGWARAATRLAVPVMAAVLLASLVFGALRVILLRIFVYGALAAAAFLVGEYVCKPLIDRTYYDELSFPSGNVTAVCAVALAMWLAVFPVLGRPARWVSAAVGAAWVLVVSVDVVAAEWHTPLDDVGAVLLAVGVVTAGGAVVEPLTSRRLRRVAQNAGGGLN